MRIKSLAGLFAAFTICSAALVPISAGFVDNVAMWTGLVGFVLILIGVFAGAGWAVATGTSFLAFVAALAMEGRPVAASLAVYALTAVICLAVLTGADFSFQGRRHAWISSEVLMGRWTASAVVVLVGVASSVSVLALVLLIEWPGWILPFPLLMLAIAAIGLGRRLLHHRKRLEEQYPLRSVRF